MKLDKAQDFSLLIEAARAQADGRREDALKLVGMVSPRSQELGKSLLESTENREPALATRFLRELAGVQAN